MPNNKPAELTPEIVRKLCRRLGGTKDLAGDLEEACQRVLNGDSYADVLVKMQADKSFAQWCLGNVATTKARLAQEQTKPRNVYSKRSSTLEVDMICHCGALYSTTENELRRGWGLSCSRKCATRRTKGDLKPGKRVK